MSIQPGKRDDSLKKWGDAEKEAWWLRQTIKRSYQNDIVARIKALPSDKFTVEQYGALSEDPARYPLFRVMTKPWNPDNPTIAVTGGMHGYEPSGITGALRFLEEVAPKFADRINFVVHPCLSPLAYEIDHRWNRRAEDPNRECRVGGTAEESILFMASIEELSRKFNKVAGLFASSVDLHETNDRDKELTLERRAKNGEVPEEDDTYIPEGFYLVVADKADVALGRDVIAEVRKVTPICKDHKILGYPSDGGIIVIDNVEGLCQGFMRKYSGASVTTEIYPEKCSREESEAAQLASIQAAINDVLKPKI